MDVLFVGSSVFGLKSLEKIHDLPEINIVGIISNPKTFSISYNKQGVTNVLHADVSKFAEKNNIPCYLMKENMKEEPLLSFIEEVNPEFGVVVGWYHIVPGMLLEKFRFAGLHASLLPDYSGGAPLVWAIINGEKKTGITFFCFDKGVDNGDIIGQEEVEITERDTIKTLYDKIEIKGFSLLSEYLPKIASGSTDFSKQDDSQRNVFPQRSPGDGKIDWASDAKTIYNFVRAQTQPYPGAFCTYNNSKLIIWEAAYSAGRDEESTTSGEVIDIDESGSVTVATGDGNLILSKVSYVEKEGQAADIIKTTGEILG